MKAMGLDLSLTASGVAIVGKEGGKVTRRAVRTLKNKLRGYERIEFIAGSIVRQVSEEKPDLIIVEWASFGSSGPGHDELAGLRWIVTSQLYRSGFRLATTSPNTVKAYMAANGHADKVAMIEAVKGHFPTFRGDDNAADALSMACMAMHHLGDPVIEKDDRAARFLDGVNWDWKGVVIRTKKKTTPKRKKEI